MLLRFFILLLFIAVLVGISVALFKTRDSIIATFNTPEAQAEWQAWRDEAAEQAAGKGSVNRRIPKSPQPPALILMRDYFGVCWSLSLVISSALMAAFLFFVRGVMQPTKLDATSRSDE